MNYKGNNFLNIRKKGLDSIKKLYIGKKYSKALKEIKKYCNCYPDDYFGIFLMAQIYKAMNDLDEARNLFFKVWDSTSSNRFSALVEIGKIEEIYGKKDVARKCYLEAINSSPNVETFALFSLSRLERLAGHTNMAISYLDSIPESYHDRKYLELAKIARDNQDYLKMATNLSFISETNDEKFNREVLIERGRLEAIFYNYQGARNYFLGARNVTINDRDYIFWKSYYEEARMYFEKEDYDKALNILNYMKCSNISLNGLVSLLLGLIDLKKLDILAAYDNFCDATYHCQGNSLDEALFHLADIELELGDYDNAFLHYQAIQRPTKSSLFKLIAISIRKQEYEKGYIYLEQLRHLNSKIENDQGFINTKLLLDRLTNKELSAVHHTYIEEQLIHYDSDAALRMISKNTFNASISLDKLYFDVLDMACDKYKIQSEIFDVYDIPYPNVGYVNGEETDYLRVVMIPDTNEVLTIYPCCKDNLKRHINLEDFYSLDNKRKISSIKSFVKK